WLGKLPFLKGRGLGHFHRAVIGGCAYVLTKDLVHMLYRYLFYRTRIGRTVQGRKRP
ncbi:hypothetical protein EC988_008202, partial [Linderina pennispora]